MRVTSSSYIDDGVKSLVNYTRKLAMEFRPGFARISCEERGPHIPVRDIRMRIKASITDIYTQPGWPEGL